MNTLAILNESEIVCRDTLITLHLMDLHFAFTQQKGRGCGLTLVIL